MKENIKNLLKNTLLAQGLADAFGYLVEFKKWEQIKIMYGNNGIAYNPELLNLVATDDTQMNLFCLDGLISATQDCGNKELEDPTEYIYKSYLNWLKTQWNNQEEIVIKNGEFNLMSYKELYYKRAPGNTCLSALGSKRKGTVKNPINDSKGCGGIMRTMPISFYAKNIEDAFDWGVKQAAITHGHPDGYLSAGFYNAVAYELIHNKKDIIIAIKKAEEAMKIYSKTANMENTINKTVWAINNFHGLEHNSLTDELGFGWVGEEALAIALYCATTSITFKELLEKSSNHSGDSDSTAMLAAGLWYLNNRDDSFLKDTQYFDLNNCITDIVDNIN